MFNIYPKGLWFTQGFRVQDQGLGFSVFFKDFFFCFFVNITIFYLFFVFLFYGLPKGLGFRIRVQGLLFMIYPRVQGLGLEFRVQCFSVKNLVFMIIQGFRVQDQILRFSVYDLPKGLGFRIRVQGLVLKYIFFKELFSFLLMIIIIYLFCIFIFKNII